MMVLDASAALELLLARPGGAKVLARISEPGETLHAPHLVDVEILQVLRRYAATGELSDERAALALEDLHALELERYPHDTLTNRIWQLRANVTAYDAAYLALAEALGAPLVTFDAKLARARGHRARIVLLE